MFSRSHHENRLENCCTIQYYCIRRRFTSDARSRAETRSSKSHVTRLLEVRIRNFFSKIIRIRDIFREVDIRKRIRFIDLIFACCLSRIEDLKSHYNRDFRI